MKRETDRDMIFYKIIINYNIQFNYKANMVFNFLSWKIIQNYLKFIEI